MADKERNMRRGMQYVNRRRRCAGNYGDECWTIANGKISRSEIC